ncbi:MAG: hypothetical protein AAF497_04935 [Planctomycetota bacterium]
MHIEFVDRHNLLTESNREHAERNLLFALSRFSNEIEQVCVNVKDTNGPKGGVDIECLAQVKLQRLGTVEVKQLSVNFGSGIPHLARRLGRAVSRRIQVRRGFTRQSIRTAEWPTDTTSPSPSSPEV